MTAAELEEKLGPPLAEIRRLIYEHNSEFLRLQANLDLADGREKSAEDWARQWQAYAKEVKADKVALEKDATGLRVDIGRLRDEIEFLRSERSTTGPETKTEQSASAAQMATAASDDDRTYLAALARALEEGRRGFYELFPRADTAAILSMLQLHSLYQLRKAMGERNQSCASAMLLNLYQIAANMKELWDKRRSQRFMSYDAALDLLSGRAHPAALRQSLHVTEEAHEDSEYFEKVLKHFRDFSHIDLGEFFIEVDYQGRAFRVS